MASTTQYLIKESTLQGIADAIRAKAGTTGNIAVASFATKIAAIEPTTQEVTITYANAGQTITPDNGKYISKVTVSISTWDGTYSLETA